MFRRILALFAAAPYHAIIELDDEEKRVPDITKEVARKMGYAMLKPRCLLLLIAMNHFEKKGMLRESGNYKFRFDENGRFELIKEDS